MLKAYPVEKHIINKYFEDINEDSNKQSTVANLALVLIYNLFEVRRFMGNSSQYMQLIARITSLGPEIREFLLKCQLVGRLMEVFFDEVSPHKDYFRDMSDIVPKFKLNPDMGIPTEIDKKQLTHF